MQFTKQLLVAILAAITTASCKTDANSIVGNWAVNLDATISQAKSIGASEADIQDVKNTYQDGKIRIKDSEIEVFITGIGGEIRYSYAITGRQGDCSLLKVDGQSGPYKYCINNGQLIVHDPSTPLIAVYDRQ